MTSEQLIAEACPKIRDYGWAYYFVSATTERGKELGLDPLQWYFLGRGGGLGDVEASVARAAFGMGSTSLVVATLICLVTSQVISYIKARAEASGLDGGGGLIERPERLIIVLNGAGLSGLFGVPILLHVAMWVLAVASLVTVAQRIHRVRCSPGAMDPLPPATPQTPDAGES